MKPQGKLYQERLTGEIIGAAITVYRQLGPDSWNQPMPRACVGNSSCETLASSVRSRFLWNKKASASIVAIVSISW